MKAPGLIKRTICFLLVLLLIPWSASAQGSKSGLRENESDPEPQEQSLSGISSLGFVIQMIGEDILNPDTRYELIKFILPKPMDLKFPWHLLTD